ncbi:MAG: alpha/beta hydrolase, partial [Geothrix sp.]|nr:alpha/beta hydrolase [Geothrix sp.]
MRSMAWAVLFCGFALAAPLQAAGQGQPLGTWVGHWTREGSTVDITMRVAKGPQGLEGSFDSEGLRVVGIPLRNLVWSPPKLTWEVVGDATTETYAGQLRGEVLTGEFKQGEATGSFSFTRASHVPPPPRQEDITFPSGNLTLAGTIFIPAGKGPHPGVVFLHGSGAEGRWASNFLAAAFARRGFAALAYDKRGVGKSGGNWQGAG